MYTRHSDPVTDALKHRLQARLHRFSKRRLCQRTDQSVFTQNQSPRTEITGSVTKAPLLVSQPLGLCVGTTRICNPCSRSKLLPKIPVAHRTMCGSSRAMCEPSRTMCERFGAMCGSLEAMCGSLGTMCEPSRTMCEPSRTMCEPSRTMCEPSRTMCEASRTTCEPFRAMCEPSLTMCDQRRSSEIFASPR